MPDATITTLTLTPKQFAALRLAVGYWLNPERAREPGYVDSILDVQAILQEGGVRVVVVVGATAETHATMSAT